MADEKIIDGVVAPRTYDDVKKCTRSEEPWNSLKQRVLIAFANNYELTAVCQDLSNKFALNDPANDYTFFCMVIKKDAFEFDDKLKNVQNYNRYFEFDLGKGNVLVWIQANQAVVEWIERNKKIRDILKKQDFLAYAE